MCDARRTTGSTRRPCWGALYTIVGLALLVLTVADRLAPSAGRGVVGCVLVPAAGAAMFGWIRRNRVALDQLHWCDCASSTVRIRVIDPDESRRPPTAPAGPVPVTVRAADDDAEMLVGARDLRARRTTVAPSAAALPDRTAVAGNTGDPRPGRRGAARAGST